MNVLVFDIETIPDTDGARRLDAGLAGLDDAQVADAMFHLRRQETGSDFIRHHLQRVVAISAVLRSGSQLRVWSLGTPQSGEAELIQRFFDGIGKYTPTLVSWNGGGFDLPVLHYRALLHGVQAPRYWETVDSEPGLRYNHYLARFHWRHTDLMDVLAGYQPRACAPLDEIATLLGLPGKLGMDGSKVWDAYRAGRLDAIRAYCETDVLNTYLVWLRFELMRGNLGPEGYAGECRLLRDWLVQNPQPHFDEFRAGWTNCPGD